ncbi:hypothetical protein V2J09_005488 [Rumex salicifolius]
MNVSGGGAGDLAEAYQPLPAVYLALLSIWCVSAFCWLIVTWRNRNFETNRLQWMLATVPLIKTLQYSCFYSQTCSLWMSFGVYITGILFQTASFVSFLLISHGYCIMCEHLSAQERRITALLGCLFYLTLIGYKASVPYFTVLLLLNYTVSFSLIFRHISQNLLALQEQLSVIEHEDIHVLYDTVHLKYIMFKKFQVAMQLMALAETAIYINMDDSVETYWFRLLVREWAHFCIFLYIGWTFRARNLAPQFSVMPNVKSKVGATVPPIYSIAMDAASFKDFCSQEWHIGVPSSLSLAQDEGSKDSILVIVQHPSSMSYCSNLT